MTEQLCNLLACRQVDLGDTYSVLNVTLYNRCVQSLPSCPPSTTAKPLTQPFPAPPPRADCCSERLTYFEVRVGLTDSAVDPTANALCAWYTTPAQSMYQLTCTTPLVGRYVSVRLPPGTARGNDVLSIGEAQVYGSLA